MKYSGKIGYREEVDNGYGIWVNEITEYLIKGEFVQVYKSDDSTNKVNEDFKYRNRISVVLSNSMIKNISNIIYITYMGRKYSVSNVEINIYNPKRVIISIGEEYNERTTDTSA